MSYCVTINDIIIIQANARKNRTVHSYMTIICADRVRYIRFNKLIYYDIIYCLYVTLHSVVYGNTYQSVLE